MATLEIAMPDAPAREAFVTWFDGRDDKLGNLTDFTPTQLAELTGGLNLVNLERLLAGAEQSGQKLDGQRAQAPEERTDRAAGARAWSSSSSRRTSLDDFVGNDAVKQRLIDDAALLAKGRLDAAPMGYLICGPVGTGKTYLAECFAGSVGIPCVKLRNFRSKYVGETEGNLEQFLDRAPRHGAGRRRNRRGRRGAGKPRIGRRFRHLEPRLLDDRQPDGRHSLSRQADLDAPDQPP